MNETLVYYLNKRLTDIEASEIMLVLGGCSKLVSKNIRFLLCEEHRLKNQVKTQFRLHIIKHYCGKPDVGPYD